MELGIRRREGLSAGIGFYVFAAILLVRLVVLLRMADSPFLLPNQGDMAFYNDWARRILQGQAGERLAFYGLPGYAYLLAGIYYLFGYSPFTPELLQACADAGTGVLIYKISTHLFNRAGAAAGRGTWIGVLAALGWAFFQPAQAYSAILMPTSLAVFLFWLVVWQILRRDDLPKLTWFGLFGCLIGLCATGVATVLFLLPLIVLASFCKWRPAAARARFWIRRSLCTFLVLLGVVIGTAPCWIHNYFYAHDSVFLSAHSGVNFWIGNNPTANGYPKFPPGLHAGQQSMLQDSVSAAERAAGHPLQRSEVSAYWSGQAASYIKQHFVQWLRLLVRKIDNFWNAFQYDDLSIISILREERIIPPGLSFGIVAALALGACVFAILENSLAIWIAAAIALQVCALLPVFVTERYRLPAVPGLLVFAAYGLCTFARQCQDLRVKPLIVSFGLLTITVLLVSRPRQETSLWALDSYNSGIAALRLERFDEAAKKLELACAYAPKNAEVNFALGNLRLAEGDRAQAKAYYCKTIALDPHHGRAFNNLGVIALAEERWQLAERFLGEALRQNSREATTHFLMAKSLLGEGNQDAARREIDTAIALEPNQTAFAALRDEVDRTLKKPE